MYHLSCCLAVDDCLVICHDTCSRCPLSGGQDGLSDWEHQPVTRMGKEGDQCIWGPTHLTISVSTSQDGAVSEKAMALVLLPAAGPCMHGSSSHVLVLVQIGRIACGPLALACMQMLPQMLLPLCCFMTFRPDAIRMAATSSCWAAVAGPFPWPSSARHPAWNQRPGW